MKAVIAEIGSVHDGSIGNARKLIAVAADCGARVIKFQTHIADAETIRDAPMPTYFRDEPRFDYFERTSFSLDQWEILLKDCSDHGVTFMSSCFSIKAVDLLESIGATMYKVPSGEVTNTPLIEYLAKKKKPVFLSSGMSSWSELDAAVEILRGNVELCVMQCTSAYPCPTHKVGLNIFDEMRNRYGSEIDIGFSDHTQGLAAGPAAAALGVSVIEKHLTFSNEMFGSDAKNALEPKKFSLYCDLVEEVWIMKSHPVDKNDLTDFMEMKSVFEKSIVASKNIEAGTRISMEHLEFKKPGDGISAAGYKALIGLKALRDLSANHMFSIEDFE